MLETFHPLVRRWFERRFGRADRAPGARRGPRSPRGGTCSCRRPPARGRRSPPSSTRSTGSTATRSPAGSARRPGSSTSRRSARSGTTSRRTCAAPLAELAAARPRRGAPPRPTSASRSAPATPPPRGAQALVRRPPHILVTTPESLYLLLTAERGRAALARVETVIVDEIHAVARDKRGAHLALSLERLEALARRRPQRIGLSATREPRRGDGPVPRRHRARRRRRPAALRDRRGGAAPRVRPRRSRSRADELSSVASNEPVARDLRPRRRARRASTARRSSS